MTEPHLIIFVKNPVPGTVKTRIARTVGDERAAQVYETLEDTLPDNKYSRRVSR